MRGVRFLSPDWLAALDTAVQGDERLGSVPPGTHLVVQQVITGDTPVAYHLVLGDGGPHVRVGIDDDADLTLTTDPTTAAAIARGEDGAATAVLDGRLRVSGDAADNINPSNLSDVVGSYARASAADTEAAIAAAKAAFPAWSRSGILQRWEILSKTAHEIFARKAELPVDLNFDPLHIG